MRNLNHHGDNDDDDGDDDDDDDDEDDDDDDDTFMSLTGSQLEFAVSCSLKAPSNVAKMSSIWQYTIMIMMIFCGKYFGIKANL